MIEIKNLVGQVLTEELKTAIKAQQASVRIMPSDAAYTMDSKPFRTNVQYDKNNNVITKVWYG